MVNGSPEMVISKDHNIMAEDIEDYIKSIFCKNPDAISIHSGTNDVTNIKPTK